MPETFPALSAVTIRARRLAVRDRAREASPRFQTARLEVLGDSDLYLLFSAYDDLFFRNHLSRLLTATRSHLHFEVSTRMSSAGANISQHGSGNTHRVYRVAVSAPVLAASFRTPGQAFLVNGVQCTDRLEALQLVLEHELVHLYELLTTGRSAHGPTFRRTAWDLFEHTDFRHALMTPRTHVATALDLRLGDRVSFPFAGRKLVGTLNRVTSRATVLVPDRGGVKYTDGQHYRKFYVPVNALTKVERT
jgi:hypothetical protein